MKDLIMILRDKGIKPTPQRLAVARYVLGNREHPYADQVLENVRKSCPTMSRATVYNTLNLFVKKGLLKTQLLKEGTVVFDGLAETHHHFIDEETGKIYDIPWEAVKVPKMKNLGEFEVREYQVVMRGKKRHRKRKA